MPYLTIDVHCHLYTIEVETLVKDRPEKRAEIENASNMMGEASAQVNGERFSALLPKLTGVSERLRDMDAMGVDIQAVSPSPTQYYYWANPDLAADINIRQNDDVSALCAEHPDRFFGLGTVAMQYPERAAAQLEALIRDRGFKGVQISTLVNGRDVADRYFDPFWQKADELGAVVLIHPWGTSLGSRLADYYLMNTLGQPLETTICLSKLIFSGAFDRWSGMKIIAAHGGGYLPLYVGRSDHARSVRPDAGSCACCPSDYLRRIWYDTVVYDPAHVKRLIEAVGPTQIVVGTDYPFDMGHYDPSSLVVGFDEQTQRMILGENAALLFGLSER